jgi:hypothetical protein
MKLVEFNYSTWDNEYDNIRSPKAATAVSELLETHGRNLREVFSWSEDGMGTRVYHYSSEGIVK